MWRSVLVILPCLLIACGGGDDEGDDTPTSSDCSDPNYNPWSGTCVETFHADCFDPEGECTGEFDQATGDTTLEWANGATVETSVNFATFGATTEIYGSDGTLCSTGESQNNAGGCASQTVYTRADGSTMTYCIQADGAMDVTCPDGSTHSVSSAEQQAASQCQYGDGEACTIEGLPTTY